MMKPLFCLVLLLASMPASAQGWVSYMQNDASVMYFDSLRTRKMGDTAFVWDLHDFSAPAKDHEGRPFQSVLYATEYQCRARKWRVLSLSRMAGKMGSGETVSEESLVSAWHDTAPGSRADELFKHICE